MTLLTSYFTIECELGGRDKTDCSGDCTTVNPWKDKAEVCRYLKIRSVIKVKGK